MAATRKKARELPSPYSMPVFGDTLPKVPQTAWQTSELVSEKQLKIPLHDVVAGPVVRRAALLALQW